MRILLTTQKWLREEEPDNPIAVLDLAPLLRRWGHEVDCRYIHDLVEGEYDLAGISCFWGNEKVIKRHLSLLRERYPAVKIVIGGRYVNIMSDELKNYLIGEKIEICPGEGERYFNKTEEIDFNNYPSWDIKDLKSLNSDGDGIMSSRGCPYSCNFCYNSAKRVKFFSPSRTVDNIELMFKMGIRDVFFVDDIFTLNMQHMSNIYDSCKKRNVKIQKRNHFLTHINSINKESVKIMGMFSPTRVEVGIESGDDRMLQLMGKNITREVIYEKVKLLSKYVAVHGLFLIGYPGETIQSLQNTIDFVKRTKKYLSAIWVSYYVPIPNTAGFDAALNNGIITNSEIDNRAIGYVDNNLTVEVLQKARSALFETASKKSFFYLAGSRIKRLIKK